MKAKMDGNQKIGGSADDDNAAACCVNPTCQDFDHKTCFYLPEE